MASISSMKIMDGAILRAMSNKTYIQIHRSGHLVAVQKKVTPFFQFTSDFRHDFFINVLNKTHLVSS
jgi:hypothetical protein